MTTKPAALLLASLLSVAQPAAAAENEVRTITKSAAFEDVKADVLDAIIARGLSADQVSDTGGMLGRTAEAVGATKPVYKHAQIVSFCSAKLAHAMASANPGNLAGCPSQIFLYETIAGPGTVTVGYRTPYAADDTASKAAQAGLTALLDGILADVKK
jgi:Domain of unknown function DUF302